MNTELKLIFNLTQNLLEWMGYCGRNTSDKQLSFVKALRSLEIPYDEIDCSHPLTTEYPCVQKEVKQLVYQSIQQ